jgi:hypothetical protein
VFLIRYKNTTQNRIPALASHSSLNSRDPQEPAHRNSAAAQVEANQRRQDLETTQITPVKASSQQTAPIPTQNAHYVSDNSSTTIVLLPTLIIRESST